MVGCPRIRDVSRRQLRHRLVLQFLGIKQATPRETVIFGNDQQSRIPKDRLSAHKTRTRQRQAHHRHINLAVYHSRTLVEVIELKEAQLHIGTPALKLGDNAGRQLIKTATQITDGQLQGPALGPAARIL